MDDKERRRRESAERARQSRHGGPEGDRIGGGERHPGGGTCLIWAVGYLGTLAAVLAATIWSVRYFI